MWNFSASSVIEASRRPSWSRTPRHADGNVVFGEPPAIGDGGVLHAPVGVMDQTAGLRLSGIESRIPRGNGE
jgi:hypothetical protein